MHQQRLTATSRIPKSQLVQIIQFVFWDLVFFGFVHIELGNMNIQIGQQFVWIAKEPIQKYFSEQQ